MYNKEKICEGANCGLDNLMKKIKYKKLDNLFNKFI